jgi:hypothetical protein
LAGTYAVAFDLVLALELSHGGVIALGYLAEVVTLLDGHLAAAASAFLAFM